RTTGHFREFKNLAGAAISTDQATLLSSVSSLVNWDGATWIAANAGSRKIYVVDASKNLIDFKSTAASTLAPLLGLTLGVSDVALADNVRKKVLNYNPSTSTYNPNVLGAIDYSTAAYVEAKGTNGPVSVRDTSSVEQAQTRAAVAYVGARDGMLHAFCAETSGSTKCTPGEELFAIVP